MSTPKKATRRQLLSALDTLAIVGETEDLQHGENDHIAEVQTLLWDIIDNRDDKRGKP